jgi:hypothetical protein
MFEIYEQFKKEGLFSISSKLKEPPKYISSLSNSNTNTNLPEKVNYKNSLIEV